MPEVQPFYGWRYNPSRVDLSRVVAPPYDVVSPEEIAGYLSKDPYNIFHLELGQEGPDRYLRAAEKLNDWIRRGILQREKVPSLYLYRLRFSYEGRSYVRTGFIGLVRLSPFSEGRILPHEKTFPKVTEDRLRLLRATQAQFSQIFVLYRDPDLQTLQDIPSELLFQVKGPEGGVHEIHRVSDPRVQTRLLNFWEPLTFYIADGHHRYTTALRFAEEMTARLRPEGPRCFHYMMMYLCPFEDPGLLVLPTHRILRRLPHQQKLAKVLHSLATVKEISPSLGPSPSLEERAFVLRSKETTYLLHLKDEVLRQWESESQLPERELPAAWCARLIRMLFGETEKDLKEKGLLTYTPWEEEIQKEVSKGALAILLPPTPVSVLRRVAESGQVMPHKSTYFHPKILTGCVLFRLNMQTGPPCP